MAGVEGGYDHDFTDEIPEELWCSICLHVLRDPNLTSCCGHRYCRECINRVKRAGMPCPLCQSRDFTVMLDKLFVRKVNSLRVKCPNMREGCEWCGELGQVDTHLLGCRYTAVNCDFYSLGCREMVSRSKMREHLGSSSGAHLALVMGAFQRKDKQISELKQTVSALQTEVKSLRESVRSLSLAIPRKYPPVDLFMIEYESHRDSETTWFSDPFYSHPRGYKMCLTVYANGTGKGKDSHVSVFATLMRGEYDDELVWPFRGSVSVELLGIEDYYGEELDISGVFKFNSRTPPRATKRPIEEDRNKYGHGDPEFVEHEDIPYDIDDLHFRVTETTVQ